MFEWILAAVLWALVVALLAAGGVIGVGVVTLWMLGGLYMIANSRSRGLLADASFMVTWPIYLALNR